MSYVKQLTAQFTTGIARGGGNVAMTKGIDSGQALNLHDVASIIDPRGAAGDQPLGVQSGDHPLHPFEQARAGQNQL